MEPVRGGRLASLSQEADGILKAKQPDWSIASWVFRWLKGLSGIPVILSGMTTMEQIVENVTVFSDDRMLTEEENDTLMRACETFRSQVQVPCTSCRYCCDDCPTAINIPDYLDVYNRYKVDGPWALSDLEGVKSEGKLSDCIDCGACTGHCPQSIDIPATLKELAAAK